MTVIQGWYGEGIKRQRFDWDLGCSMSIRSRSCQTIERSGKNESILQVGLRVTTSTRTRKTLNDFYRQVVAIYW